MAKVRTTLTIDDEVLKAVKIRATRAGQGDSEVIEDTIGISWPAGLREVATRTSSASIASTRFGRPVRVWIVSPAKPCRTVRAS